MEACTSRCKQPWLWGRPVYTRLPWLLASSGFNVVRSEVERGRRVYRKRLFIELSIKVLPRYIFHDQFCDSISEYNPIVIANFQKAQAAFYIKPKYAAQSYFITMPEMKVEDEDIDSKALVFTIGAVLMYESCSGGGGSG